MIVLSLIMSTHAYDSQSNLIKSQYSKTNLESCIYMVKKKKVQKGAIHQGAL